jgi:glycosyltransferase involved in cell wall biosynthesis
VTKEIQKIKPDIICLNERISGLFPSRLQIPKIFITHNPDAMRFYKKFSIKINVLNLIFFDFKRIIEEQIFSHSDALIALNTKIKEYLEKQGYNKIIVIPNAVDPTIYFNQGDFNYILFAGRLNEVKGIPYLIQAFSEISHQFDTRLCIIGSGPQKQTIHNLASFYKINNKVDFYPMVLKKELRQYLSKCSIFVFPSLFETMGVTLLEAMASGKPVISSNIPGPKDIIIHGENGLLFERGNINELKECLIACLSNPQLRQILGENAKKTVVKKFSFNITSQQYLELFDYLIQENLND